MKQSTKKPPKVAPRRSDLEQSNRFRKAAREAGVDPDADIDEVMRRLALQDRAERKPKQRP